MGAILLLLGQAFWTDMPQAISMALQFDLGPLLQCPYVHPHKGERGWLCPVALRLELRVGPFLSF